MLILSCCVSLCLTVTVSSCIVVLSTVTANGVSCLLKPAVRLPVDLIHRKGVKVIF